MLTELEPKEVQRQPLGNGDCTNGGKCWKRQFAPTTTSTWRNERTLSSRTPQPQAKHPEGNSASRRSADIACRAVRAIRCNRNTVTINLSNKQRHRGGKSCDIRVTPEFFSSFDSFKLMSTQIGTLTSTNCSLVTSLPHEPNWEPEVTSSFLKVGQGIDLAG